MGSEVEVSDIARVAGHRYIIDNGITVPHLDPLFLTDITLSVRRIIPVTRCSLWRAPVYVMFFVRWKNTDSKDVFEAVVFRGGFNEGALFSVLQGDRGVIVGLIDKQ